jgi:hypothetical protein
MTYLRELAAAARPIDDDDYGTARQIDAENDFFDTLDLYLAGLSREKLEAFDTFCLKATTDERITEGLRLATWAMSMHNI